MEYQPGKDVFSRHFWGTGQPFALGVAFFCGFIAAFIPLFAPWNTCVFMLQIIILHARFSIFAFMLPI